MAICYRPTWQPGDNACAEPRADRGCRHHRNERGRTHAYDTDEYQALRYRGQRMADIQRPRDPFVGDEAPHLERRGGRRKRADAEGIEKVGNEADGQTQHARIRGRRGARACALDPKPVPREERRQPSENGEQDVCRGHAAPSA